jgi:hypothetical protein
MLSERPEATVVWNVVASDPLKRLRSAHRRRMYLSPSATKDWALSKALHTEVMSTGIDKFNPLWRGL